MRIFVFGDSISQGFFDSQGGWVQRLANEYHTKSLKAMRGNKDYYVEMFNLGISGDTTEGVIDRLVNEVKSRRLYPDDELVILAIGLNDSMFRGDTPETTLDEYKKLLPKLIAEAQKVSNRILIVGLTAVDDALCNPWRWSSSGKSYRNDKIWEYEFLLRQFSQENALPMVALFESFKSPKDNLFADGLHPNDVGHGVIANEVKPYIDKIVGS